MYDTHFTSPDGLTLSATLVPSDELQHAAVLVHGGGVAREEGGFFARLAASLADVGVASLRFDLRGHGKSEGRQEETATFMARMTGYTEATQPRESHRATLTVRNAEGGRATLIVARRGEGRQAMVWLSLSSTTATTAVLGSDEAVQLIEMMHAARQGR